MILGVFGLNGNGFANAGSWLYIKNNCFFFAAAIIACTPIVPFVHRKLYEASKRSRAIRAITHVLEAALPSVLLMISICALAGDSFNPFMYLKF
jgi:alginate O-acetyltransferase complex protein AlgI